MFPKYSMQFLKKAFFRMIPDLLLAVLGSGILAFGLCQIHAISNVTEGGCLGLTLLLQQWLHLSPAISGLFINLACYGLGIRTLGRRFLLLSTISAGCYSLFYAWFETFPLFWAELASMPLVASLAGAGFVGLGVGLCVRAGGAPTGDDALAMSLHRLWKTPIEWVYLISDLTVLLLSLSYIPLSRIGYSLLTVILSGKLIGIIQRFSFDRISG